MEILQCVSSCQYNICCSFHLIFLQKKLANMKATISMECLWTKESTGLKVRIVYSKNKSNIGAKKAF